MAYNFPNSPSNGDTVVVNGVTYEYNSTDNAWKTGTGVGPAITSDGSTPSLASGITAAEIRTLIDSPDLSSVDTDIIPDGDGTRDLGSSTAKWKDLYLSGNSLFLGGHSITADSSAILFPEIKIGTGSDQVTLSASGGELQTGGSDIFSGAFADLTGKPTTVAGYGITDGATQSYVTTQINNVIDSAPGALNTLNELAAALGDDANFSTTVTNNLALKAPLASPSLTGTPTAPTATTGNNTTQIATTAFVQSAISGAGSYNDASVDTHLNRTTAATGEVLSWNGSDYDWVARTTFSTLSGKPTTLSGYGITDGATIDSPAFTGTPTAPTASGGTNSTQIATTAYVQGEISSFSGGDSQRDYTATGSITDKNAVVLNSDGTVSNVSVINAGFNTSTRPRVSSTGTSTNLHAGSDWNSTDSVFHTAYRDGTTLYIRAMAPSFSALTLSTVTTTTTSLGGTSNSTIIYKHIEGTSTGILFYNSSGWKAKYITYDNSIPTHNIGTNTFSLTGEPYDVVIKDSGRMFILYSGSVASVAIDASSKTFTLTDTASSTLTVGSGTFHAFRLFWDTIQSKIILFKSASNSNSYQYISESSGSLTASTAGSGNTTTFQQIEYHPGLSTYFGIRYTVLQGPPIDKIEPKFTPLTAGASSVTYGSEVTTGITIDKYDTYNQFTQHGEIRFLPSLTGNGVSIFSLATVANSQYGDQDYGKERFAFGTLTSSATYTDNGSGFAKLYSGTTQNSEWYAHDFSMVTKVDGYAYVTYPISSGGQIGTTLVRTASVSNANEYLGIAQNAASNGGSVTVMLAGGISTGHSSLTQDVKYYVQNDGTIATTSSSTVAGHSVSTDSIQVADSQGIFASSTAFADLTSTPTTLSGYGITDAISSAGDVDIGSSDFITTGKSYYANMFATTGDLPSATTYHGMFAHVHGTGAGYFAHAGNWVELANKSYVDTEVANLVNSAPSTLDTLDELAAALNDDANFATTVTTSLGLKAPLASPALTGTPTAPTASSGTNSTQIATTAFVAAAVSGLGGGGGASVTTSDAAPSSPSAGDLWYNTDAGGLFLYYTDADSSQWVEVVGKTGPTGATGAAGGSTITVSDAAPSSPVAGQLWWNSTSNKLYIYYTDANSSQWVQATTPGAAGATGATGADGAAGASPGRNKFINGNFDVWQRGTSRTTSGHLADRWRTGVVGNSQCTFSQQSFTLGQTDVPFNPEYYQRAVVTAGSDANSYVLFNQRIEDVRTFQGETVTVSFWAKADAAKDFVLEPYQYFGSTGTGGSAAVPITPQTVTLSTTWTKYTKTFSIPSITGKTLGTSGDDWLGFFFWLDAGSDWNSRAGSLGNQSGIFDFAQIQVERGSTATDFETEYYSDTLRKCQRYYYEYPKGETYSFIATGFVNNTSSAHVLLQYPQRMRAVPTQTSTGNFQIIERGTGHTVTAFQLIDPTVDSGRLTCTTGAYMAQGGGCVLRNLNDANATIMLEAEL